MSEEIEDDTKQYWKGRYKESVDARKELDELIKHLISQLQIAQQQQQQDKGSSGATAAVDSNPFTSQLGALIGAFPALLMVLFGVYGTGTGADIGIPMIIIGAIFSLFAVPYLLTRRTERLKLKKEEKDVG